MIHNLLRTKRTQPDDSSTKQPTECFKLPLDLIHMMEKYP